MGQAKKLGTYEQRVAQARTKMDELLKEQNMALGKPKSSPVMVEHSRSRLTLSAMLAVGAAISPISLPPKR